MKKIFEAAPREVMTKREKVLKKKLIALLRDDGKGHRHPKYAARLEDFMVKIVYLKDEPLYTAAINFEDATIYISEGFLNGGPEVFSQLNVVMRHELAHYLMMHQIRMLDKLISKYGKEGGTRLSMSKSIHELMNIIEDFEISNERYTDADKQTMRRLIINFQEIPCLVTEDIRKDWQKLNVIQMYDYLSQEIANITSTLRWQYWGNIPYEELVSEVGKTDSDWIKERVRDTVYVYANEKGNTNFLGSIEKYLKDKALYHFVPYDSANRLCVIKFSNLPDNFQFVVKELYDIISNNKISFITDEDKETYKDYKYTKKAVRSLILEIVQSNPFEILNLKNKDFRDGIQNPLITLYTPEEKFIAVDVLKAMLPTLEVYQTWYDKVKRVLGDTSKYTAADIQSVIDALK